VFNIQFLPLFYVKLGMMNHFVEAMHHYGKAYQYLQLKVSKINECKIKDRIVVDPQIQNLRKDKNFDALLKGSGKAALEVFKVGENFLSKHNTHNYKTLVENILRTMRYMWCR
jgi:hypothetical protein